MAQGAAMAIEDAWVIASNTANAISVPEALLTYHSNRFARASAIQAASRANAKTFHQRTLWGQLKTYAPIWLAGRMARGAGLAKQDRVYGHNVVADAVI